MEIVMWFLTLLLPVSQPQATQPTPTMPNKNCPCGRNYNAVSDYSNIPLIPAKDFKITI